MQHVTDVMEHADRRGGGAESDSVRVELQADCCAGMAIGRLATTEDPDTWTHGSSEQRQRWFTVGYDENSHEACDTFAAEL